MEKLIRESINDMIIKKAGQLYDVEFSAIKKVGGFENFIYEFNKNGIDYILRLVHSKHRSYNQVLAEMEFIDFLASKNARVSEVVYSTNDNIIEKVEIDNNYYFSISAFIKAPGEPVKREEVTEDFLEMFGSEVGRLHKLTKAFNPTHKRIDWYEEDYVAIGRSVLPESDNALIDVGIKIKEKIMNFEKDDDSYGLIHTDLHFGNMFYNNGTLTFFDFDDASYKHYISDIAIVFFYMFAFSDLTTEERSEKMSQAIVPFMKGYKKHNYLDRKWFRRINDFFRLRTIIIYYVLNAAGEEFLKNERRRKFLESCKNRAINDTPFVNQNTILEALEKADY